MLYQQRDIYSIYRWCWNVVSTERYILYIQVLLECCINREIYTLYTSAAGMLYQQKDIYSIYRYCWNVVSTERYILYIQVLLESCINRELYTLYTGTAGMLIHINGKFTIEQLYYSPDRNHKLCNILSTQRYILHMQVLLEC